MKTLKRRSNKIGKTHAIIPDCQVKPGVNTSHLKHVGNYLAEKRPDVIVCIGDFADMPSLSSYSVGKAEAEGQRYMDDIFAARRAMDLLLAPIRKVKNYNPRMIFTLGNHEDRITREAEANPKLIGKISLDDLGYEDAGWEVHEFLKPVKVDGIEYCLEENHKVLTEDLRWVHLKHIKPGERLVGFEETCTRKTTTGKRSARRYETAWVEKHDFDVAALYEVTLADGTKIKATAEHRWLARTAAGLEWKTTMELTGLSLPRLFNTWEMDQSREAGWLAGIFDGEGWLSKPNAKQGGIQVGVAQNAGEVLDKIRAELTRLGMDFSSGGAETCKKLGIAGSSSEKLRLLGQIRPERLISKFRAAMLGRVQAQSGDISVVAVQPIGLGTIVKIKTSTGTMIAEGFPQHNCHYFTSGVMGRPVSSAAVILRERQCSGVQGHVQFTDLAFHKKTGNFALFCGTCYTHDEKYLGFQGNTTRRQIVMLHEVSEGTADPMFVSLKFLKENYDY